MTGKPRNRIAWAGAWSRGHNNARYAELLPRLANVDRFYVDMHPWWPVRGIRRRIWLPLLLSWVGMRYPLILATDWRQIGRIRNRVVCDHDDPVYSAGEIAALARPNVAAVVVTTGTVRNNLRERGVRAPIEVIPQGVAWTPRDPERIRDIRRRWLRSEDEVVVGLHQPHFEFSAELREGAVNQMYAVDALLAAMDEARRSDPRLVLWLIGRPSAKVAEFAADRPWLRLPGYRDRSTLLDYVAAFDIGAYPRAGDIRGWGSIKVLEYLACGIPTVGFDVGEMEPVRAAGAGIIVPDTPSFAKALVSLARDPNARRRMGEQGARAAVPYRWDALSTKYIALLNSLAG
jgi:glycosyltransferase involved in cell wall biosynthesis